MSPSKPRGWHGIPEPTIINRGPENGSEEALRARVRLLQARIRDLDAEFSQKQVTPEFHQEKRARLEAELAEATGYSLLGNAPPRS